MNQRDPFSPPPEDIDRLRQAIKNGKLVGHPGYTEEQIMYYGVPVEPRRGSGHRSLPKITGDEYTIRAGDTLSAIARRSGKTVAEIAAANGIKDVNVIRAGQKISLARKASEVAASVLGGTSDLRKDMESMASGDAARTNLYGEGAAYVPNPELGNPDYQELSDTVFGYNAFQQAGAPPPYAGPAIPSASFGDPPIDDAWQKTRRLLGW